MGTVGICGTEAILPPCVQKEVNEGGVCQGLIVPEADFRRFPVRLSTKPGRECRHLRKSGEAE